MKLKLFILTVLFLGITAVTYAQSQTDAPAQSKDVTTEAVAADKVTTSCHSVEAKADCVWVDADGDGKCDTCGKTKKECEEACKHEATMKKEGCAASCKYHKECGKSGK